MKKFLYSIVLLLPLLVLSCSDDNDNDDGRGGFGNSIPPVVHTDTYIYFRSLENSDLLKGIKTIDDERIEVNYIDPSEYKIRLYVDSVKEIYYEYFTKIFIGKDSLGINYIELTAQVYTNIYNNPDLTSGHTILYELRCPYLFKDNEFHVILIKCDAERAFFTQKEFYLDTKAGNVIKEGTKIIPPIIEFEINK